MGGKEEGWLALCWADRGQVLRGQSCLGFRELAWHLVGKEASSRDGWGSLSAPSDLYYQTTRQLPGKTSRQMDCTANTPVWALCLGWPQPPLHSHSQKEDGIRKSKPFVVVFGDLLVMFTPPCLDRLICFSNHSHFPFRHFDMNCANIPKCVFARGLRNLWSEYL